MKFEVATIKDIAHALGFSASTVSRALRDSHEISFDTKQKILDYAKKINYKTNPIASSLRARHSRSIGIIIAEIDNNFSSQVIKGVESVANEHGYSVIVTQSLERYNNEVDNISFLASRSIDGCLVSVSAETCDFSHFTTLCEKGFPIVFFDRIVENINCHTVTSNNFQGAYVATLHLLKNSYRKIAFLSNAPNLFISSERLKGYKKALSEYNIEFDETLVKYCLYGEMVYDEIEDVMKELLSLQNRPDAIFASGDRLTVGIVRFCRDNNLIIPDELALVGFSNLDIADLLRPSLSVIRQPAVEMGKAAAQILIKTIEAKKTSVACENIMLPIELIEGQSSKAKSELLL